jgi:hypothetical protein
MSRRLDLWSAVAKWYWARHHSYLVQTEIERWGKFTANPPVRFRQEIKGDNEFVSFFVADVKPMPPEWPLMLGDVCNNFRATLDHLAWALVQAGRTPTPQKPERVQFPICTTKREDLLATACGRLPGVSQRQVLKLSPLQPSRGFQGSCGLSAA